MSINITQLPTELQSLMFQYLEFHDLINSLTVCKVWKTLIEKNTCFLSAKQYETGSRLIIDVQGDLAIDEDLSVKDRLLIRAKNIYGRKGVNLSCDKITLVAEKIMFLGSIHANQFKDYCNRSRVSVQTGNSSNESVAHKCNLNIYLKKNPDLWSSLVAEHNSQDVP